MLATIKKFVPSNFVKSSAVTAFVNCPVPSLTAAAEPAEAADARLAAGVGLDGAHELTAELGLSPRTEVRSRTLVQHPGKLSSSSSELPTRPPAAAANVCGGTCDAGMVRFVAFGCDQGEGALLHVHAKLSWSTDAIGMCPSVQACFRQPVGVAIIVRVGSLFCWLTVSLENADHADIGFLAE